MATHKQILPPHEIIDLKVYQLGRKVKIKTGFHRISTENKSLNSLTKLFCKLSVTIINSFNSCNVDEAR